MQMVFDGILKVRDNHFDNSCAKEYKVLAYEGTTYNLSVALERIYKIDKHVKIVIQSETRQELYECGRFYKDKNRFGKYALHINDINIEERISHLVDKDVLITIE